MERGCANGSAVAELGVVDMAVCLKECGEEACEPGQGIWSGDISMGKIHQRAAAVAGAL